MNMRAFGVKAIWLIVPLFALLAPQALLAQTNVQASMTVDNTFEAFISTDDTMQGTSIGSGTDWTVTDAFNSALTPGVTNYLHIRAVNTGGPAMFIGEFSLTSASFEFPNGTQALLTNPTDWKVSSTGFGQNYATPADLGPDGTSPWGNRPSINDAARFLWHPDGATTTPVFFSVAINPITATVTLSKDFTDNDQAAQAQVDLQCSDGVVSVIDPTTLNDAGSVDFTVTGWDPATQLNCTASEGGLSQLGYFGPVFSGDCDSATGVITNIQPGSTSTCTLQNSPTMATFTVNKAFSDQNPQAASVTLDCGAGPTRLNIATNPSDATSAQGAVFTVSYFDPTSTTCTASEALLTGYTQDMQSSTCDVPVALSEPSGGNFSCGIVNLQDPVEVMVTKSYTVAHPVVADPEVALTLFCNAGTVSTTDPSNDAQMPQGGVMGPDNATKMTSGGTASFWVSEFPFEGTGCWVEETVPAGYAQSTSTCGTGSEDTGINVLPGADVPTPPTCTVTNRPTEAIFTVDKNFSDGNPQLQVSVTPACTDQGGGPGIVFTPASGQASQSGNLAFTVQYFAGTTTCTASEEDPVGYTQDLAQSSCDEDNLVVDLSKGNSCVIFNQQDPVSILAAKAYAGGGGPAATFAAACTGGSVQVAPASQAVAGGSSGEFIVSNFPWDGANCDITEPTPPTGFHEVSSDCEGLTIVPSDDDTTCTITNAATLANVRVTKDFTDGQNPTEVTVSLDCNGGLIVDQDKVITEGDANFVNFVVKDFIDGELNCTVVEDTDVLPGYIASYAAGVISQQAGDQVGLDDDAEGCHFTGVTGGAELSCVVTNDAAPQAIVITKLWQFEGSVTPSDVDTGYHLTLHCDGAVIENGDSVCGDNQGGERIGGDDSEGLYWCKRFANSDFDSSGTFMATVIPQYPGNSCYVEEKTDSNYIEVDNGCSDLSVSAKDGGDICTITNLVFFEGIPTLSEYGLAMLALLMLGVGLVGFRRFA